MKSLRELLLLGLVMAVVASPASASLIGDQVLLTLESVGPTGDGFFLFKEAAVVGAGVEYGLFGTMTYDVSDAGLSIDMFGGPFSGIATGNPDDFWGIWLQDLDWVDAAGEIVGVSITNNTFIAGSVEVVWTANTVHIAIAEQFLDATENLTLAFDVVHVPEPATMTLLGLGLAGLAYRRRKRA